MVRPRTVGGDPGTELASDYGCDDPVTPSGPPARPSVPTTCSSALQPLLDELLADPDGSNAGQTRAAVEKLLWSQVPALPLFQPVSLLVSTAERGRRHRRRAGPADHRSAHRCAALDRTCALTSVITSGQQRGA